MAKAARLRMAVLFGIVAVLNWGTLLLVVAPWEPGMAGLGVLAFTFGLRHAFDADHISAIDNTTRNLLQKGKPAEGVGFYFSLGHSTIVAALALGLAIAAHAVATGLPALQAVGGTVATGISAAFLYGIAGLNLVVLVEILRGIRRRRTGGEPADPGRPPQMGGPMGRLVGGLVRLVDTAPRMYPIGVLFGLGFDTASEVALLALSAGAASRHLPIYAVMDLPLLFAAGMALMDTADGAFMSRAYGWALANPLRQASYNLTVTGVSVAVALLVGSVEVLQIIAGRLRWNSGLWSFVGHLNFETLGYGIVALLALTWACWYAASRAGRIDRRGA